MCMYGSAMSSVEEMRLAKRQNREAGKQLVAERMTKRQALKDIMAADNIPPPKAFKVWYEKQMGRLMFYETVSRGKYIGHCECGATVPLTKAHGGAFVVCPKCRHEARLRSTRNHWYQEQDYFAYIDRAKSGRGWISHLFMIDKVYDFSGSYPTGRTIYHCYVEEEERDFIDGAGNAYAFHPRMTDGAWIPGPGRTHGMGYTGWRICDQPLKTYPGNLKRLFRGSKYQYSALEIAAREHFVDPFGYLTFYMQFPKIELLYKAGLYALARQCQSICDGHSTRRALEGIKGFKTLGISSRDELKECQGLTLEQLIARREAKGWQLTPEELGLAITFLLRLNNDRGEDFEYDFISRERLFRYWMTQRAQFSDARNFLHDYIDDYIPACIELKANLNDTAFKTPKDFKVSHDWILAEQKAQETKIYDALIEALHDSIHSLVEYSDGNFCIVMPRTSEEIVHEGVRQNHCVGRYCERVAKGESVILFVRRAEAPEEAFYTLEIKKDMKRCDVVQCRGFGNADMTDDVKTFLAKYKGWFNRRSLKNYDGDKVTVRYFKAVHKRKGRYISNADSNVEFKIGEWISADTNNDPDKVAVEGLHVASMEFAQKFGGYWSDVAILEVETNIHDVVVPNAADQVRTSKFRVIREVPMSEMGAWGKAHAKKGAA